MTVYENINVEQLKSLISHLWHVILVYPRKIKQNSLAQTRNVCV